MSSRNYAVPLLLVVTAALLLVNGLQYVLYRETSSRLEDASQYYAMRAVGNLGTLRDELNAIKTPITPDANAQLERSADKLNDIYHDFQVHFYLKPPLHNTPQATALIMGTETSSGALREMIKTKDYTRFESTRARIEALVSPLPRQLDRNFLRNFNTQLSKVPLS